MVKVQYKGRLGNQLFQYAFGRLLAEALCFQLIADPIPGFPGTQERAPGVCSPERPIALSSYDCPNLDELATVERPVLCNAYFQQWRYYAKHRTKIRQWFRLEDYNPAPYQTGDDTLVLNIRLGDYVPLGWALVPSFYSELIYQIPHNRLVIVTDEPKSRYLSAFDYLNPAIVHEDPIGDFKWLLNASKLVISQSSFSWWGAWLGHAEVWMPETARSCWSRRSPTDLRVLDDPKWHVVKAEPLLV